MIGLHFSRIHSSALPNAASARSSYAFSLVELLVVIAVTVMLTGLLMPALRNVHENAHRLMCLTNLQQVGEGFLLYAGDYNEHLPYSAILHEDNNPQDLMASMRPGEEGGWDGLGLLYSESYCGIPECFYCPSHHGKHPLDRYAKLWASHSSPTAQELTVVNVSIFTNYHYAGDAKWDDLDSRHLMLDGHNLVLATDGLRTAQDFNHTHGMNVLRADNSVRWRDDAKNIFDQLPADEASPLLTTYSNLWNDISRP